MTARELIPRRKGEVVTIGAVAPIASGTYEVVECNQQGSFALGVVLGAVASFFATSYLAYRGSR